MNEFLVIFLFTFTCAATGMLVHHTIGTFYEEWKERRDESR